MANSSKQSIDLLVRVQVLEQLVDKLMNRCDEAVIKAKQAEDLVKQVIEAVSKMQPQEKDPWEEKEPAEDNKVDELSGIIGQ